MLLPLQVWAGTSLDGALDNLLVDHVELVLIGDPSPLIILIDSFDLWRRNSLLVLLELFQFLSFRYNDRPIIWLIQYGSSFALGIDHLIPVSIISGLDFSDRLNGTLGRRWYASRRVAPLFVADIPSSSILLHFVIGSRLWIISCKRPRVFLILGN